MKKSILLFVAFCFTITTYSQNLIGAWETVTGNGKVNIRTVITFTDGYMVTTSFFKSSGKLVSTYGGSWKRIGNEIIQLIEFDYKNPVNVGTQKEYQIEVKGNKFSIEGLDNVWRRIDDGTPGKLQGAWLMSGRVKDGVTQLRKTDRPRKTMKILSGTRFQWIAYNTKTKEFKGTGGGTYGTTNGKYTENIEFFSRDNTKVGKSLEFDYSIRDGAWHHKGFSSKGDAMYEIWSQRTK